MNGLLLIGGLSQRMGQDKSQLSYHNKSQAVYLYEILSQFCDQVYLSGRKEQKKDLPKAYPFLEDASPAQGPLQGIAQIFKADAESAALVLACDLPLMKADCIEELVFSRDPNFLATVFQNPDNQLPEPLIGIWEPRAKSIIDHCLAKGWRSPRRILEENPVKLVLSKHPECLRNVNTPEESSEVLKIIQSRKKNSKD